MYTSWVAQAKKNNPVSVVSIVLRQVAYQGTQWPTAYLRPVADIVISKHFQTTPFINPSGTQKFSLTMVRD